MSNPTATGGSLDDLLANAAWMKRLARHLVRDDLDADDLVQETFVAAMRHPPDTSRPAKPWLGEVLRNFARLGARGRGRRARAFTAVAAEPQRTPLDPEAALVGVQMQQTIAREVLALPEPFRSMLVLRYYDERSAADIARELGVPAGTVRWRLKEGLDRLRARMDAQHGGDRRAWVAALVPLPTKTLWKGAVVMTAKKKAAAAAVSLVATLGVAVIVTRRPAPPAAVVEARVAAAPGFMRVFAGAPVGSAVLEGRVLDARGAPVPGASVTLATRAQPGPASAPRGVRLEAQVTSGADGRFRFDHVAPGLYRAAAATATALSAPVDVDVSAASAPVDLVLADAAGRLVGRIEDKGGGTVEGASVRARGPNDVFVVGRSDAAGAYTLALAIGRQDVRVEADGYAPASARVEVAAQTSKDFKLDPAARVSGVVTDRATGQPVAGARVRAASEDRGREREGESWEVTSDAHGAFFFGRLPPGDLRVSAAKGRAVGFLSTPVTVAATGHVTGLVLALDAALIVAGRVTNETGAPIARAGVRMQDGRADSWGLVVGPVLAVTDDDGRYRIEGVLSGRYDLAAEIPGRPAATRTITTAKADMQVDFVLVPGAVLSGLVTGADERPVVGARVAVAVRATAGRDGALRLTTAATTDAEGLFRIEALPGGHVTAEARHAAHGGREVPPFEIAVGEKKTLAIRFESPALVSGTVRWDDGAPAAGIVVKWQAGQDVETKTDGKGAFTVGPLGPGRGRVEAKAPNRRAQMSSAVETPDVKTLTLGAGERRTGVALVLARADKTIAGVVLDVDGAAAGGVEVGVIPMAFGGTSSRMFSIVDTVRSAEDGRFSVAGLQAGAYRVWAQAKGLPPASVDDVAAGARDVKLKLVRGAAVTGVAVTPDRQPIPHYTVIAASPQGPTSVGSPEGVRQDVHEAGGAFSLSGLPAGTHDVYAITSEGGASRPVRVTVAAGEKKADVRLMVAPGVVATGRLIDGDTDAGIPDLAISIGGRGGHVHAHSGADGTFRLDALVPGRPIIVSVRGANSYVSEWVELTVPTDRPTWELPPIRLAKLGPQPRGWASAGVDIAKGLGAPTVRDVKPASPAAREGVRAGDRLISVDGVDVRRYGPASAAYFLRGDPGSKANVVVQTPGGEPRQVSLERL